MAVDGGLGDIWQASEQVGRGARQSACMACRMRTALGAGAVPACPPCYNLTFDTSLKVENILKELPMQPESSDRSLTPPPDPAACGQVLRGGGSAAVVATSRAAGAPQSCSWPAVAQSASTTSTCSGERLNLLPA